MTLGEFLSLRGGDRIDNPMANTKGTVTGIVKDRRGEQEGVWITWDGAKPDTARAFTKHTTAWMHWNVLGNVEPVHKG